MLNVKHIAFGKYILPVIDGLIYEKDGNELNGELLFIDDKDGQFAISFEEDMDCIDVRIKERHPDLYHSIEMCDDGRKLYLSYPLKTRNGRPGMGYFHFEITSDNGTIYLLPGQINLGLPINHDSDMKALRVLSEIMRGVLLEGRGYK